MEFRKEVYPRDLNLGVTGIYVLKATNYAGLPRELKKRILPNMCIFLYVRARDEWGREGRKEKRKWLYKPSLSLCSIGALKLLNLN